MNQAEINTLCDALCIVYDRAAEGWDNSRGICILFGYALADLGVCGNQYWDWLDATARDWPEYSGNTTYPVPAPSGQHGVPAARAAAYAYWYAEDHDLMWCTRREYGKARWRLLAFLLDAASKLKP